MKFVTIQHQTQPIAGLWLDGGQVLDLAAAARLSGAAFDASSLLAIIQGGEPILTKIRQLSSSIGTLSSAIVSADESQILAPIPRPLKNIFCVGRNYVDHVKELGGSDLKLPVVPQFFSKPPTTIIAAGAEIRLDPNVTSKTDYEAELAIVIGKTGRDIPASSAFDYVFGYTILNDVTARDLQRRHDRWLKGKGLDTYCPIGPWIIDKETVGDPTTLRVSLTVNGELRQNATVSQMIFDIPQIIESLSAGLTLEAGDIIATGTPSGVGYAMNPPQFLKDGDVVRIEIDRIGSLTNTIKEV